MWAADTGAAAVDVRASVVTRDRCSPEFNRSLCPFPSKMPEKEVLTQSLCVSRSNTDFYRNPQQMAFVSLQFTFMLLHVSDAQD